MIEYQYGQGYSHIMCQPQSEGDSREVGTKTAEKR